MEIYWLAVHTVLEWWTEQSSG